ncbi:restriction endonuclease subunit S [Acetobacter thailandicus]|uniref:restriction endonuclease subunit S n=1 Tax=Acetobacter thailandicus TaxID=1502842 RepID=UPI001BADFFBD|nr:restriction endonuclease subunit S [Acetobacter thailandicus]MBS0986470.1 restriction endonuclease subunit S [Acetobacter thailandicus]
MSEKWRSSTWGEEISLEYGKSNRTYNTEKGRFRVYGSNGPIGWTDTALVNEPGVVLGRKGAYRGVQFSKTPFFVIDTAYYVKPKNGNDIKWLYYAIISDKLGEIDDGSPIPSTTRSAVYVREIDVPPIKEQKAIASILGSLDDKIDLNRRTNETLEALARALFRDWFVDFGPTRAKMAGEAPYLAPELWKLFPDRLDDERKPEGWKITRIGDCIERLKVGTLYSQKDLELSGTIPVLDQGKNGIIGYHNNAPNIVATPNERICTFANHTCTQKLIDFPFSTIQNVIPFKGKNFPSEWIFFATLGKQNFQEYKGHWPDFVEQTICTPDKSDVMNFYRKMIDPMLNKQSENTREIETLTQLRDLLLPKLMSGEISIRDAEKMVEDAA